MSDAAQRVLILFAHPSIGRSEVNLPLLRASRGQEGVTVVDLYADYPQYQIDIDREQRRLLEHDVVVFMFPLYWYSTPAMLKEWQDLVLEYGFAYGSDGTALWGKTFLCAITAGGAEDAYQTGGMNHYTISELLQPLEQTARLCGMRYLPPFALFGARSAVEEGRVAQHVEDWRRVLRALVSGRLNPALAVQRQRLNDDLDALLGTEPW